MLDKYADEIAPKHLSKLREIFKAAFPATDGKSSSAVSNGMSSPTKSDKSDEADCWQTVQKRAQKTGGSPACRHSVESKSSLSSLDDFGSVASSVSSGSCFADAMPSSSSASGSRRDSSSDKTDRYVIIDGSNVAFK